VAHAGLHRVHHEQVPQSADPDETGGGLTRSGMAASTRPIRAGIAKAILDDLFSAFGHEGCPLIDDTGRFDQTPLRIREVVALWNRSLENEDGD